MEFRDYYQILGVSKTASQDEIKNAFRKLAKKYHPDANPGNNSDKMFKEINEAYEVLGNPSKRAKYDKLGSSYNDFRQTGGDNNEFNWSEWFDRSSGAKRRKTKTSSNFGDAFQGGNVSDFFEKIFGQGFGAAGQGRGALQKGDDLNLEIGITLEEAFSGTSRIVESNGNTIDVKIKPGMSDGQTLKISGQGNPGRKGGQNGDLIIKIVVTAHKKVERVGDDLYIDVPVDLYKAILGGTLKIKTFSGNVEMKITAESQQNKVMRLKGLGMPKYSNPQQRGDLYVKLLIEIPKGLSDKEKKLFEELKEIREKKDTI